MNMFTNLCIRTYLEVQVMTAETKSWAIIVYKHILTNGRDNKRIIYSIEK